MKQALVGLGMLVVFVLYGLGVRHAQETVPTQAAATTPATTSSGNASSSNGQNSSRTPQAAQTPTPIRAYKNGTFAGSAEDAFYGTIQIAAVISGGKLAQINVLQFPNDHPDSVMINQTALPLLKQEAISAQNAQVDVVSGATFTSEAFQKSLANALKQAT